MAVPRLRVPSPPADGALRHRAAGLRRGRPLPPHVHDAAALERRDAAARARALAPLDDVQPARARGLRRARPRRLPVRDPPPARGGREGARDHHGPGGRGLRPPRHRPARRVDAARGARPAPPLVRRRQRHDGRAARLRLGPRRPHPHARRLPDRVEQAARAAAHARLAARRRGARAGRVRRGARRHGGRLAAAPRGLGRRYVAAARRSGSRAAQPAHPHARRHAGRLRAHDPPLVGAGARRAGRAGARRPPDVLRLLQPALDGQPAVRHGAPARGRGHALGGDATAPTTCAPSSPLFRDGRTEGSWENFLYFSARDFFEAQRRPS